MSADAGTASHCLLVATGPARLHSAFGMSTLPLNLVSALFGLSLLLTACGHQDQAQVQPPDEKLRNALTGTWTHGNDGSGMLTLDSNGTFTAQWNTTNRPMKVWAYEGTWTATGGVCMMTDTSSQSWGTTNRAPEGRTDRYRIITVDGEHLVWEDAGQTISLTRRR